MLNVYGITLRVCETVMMILAIDPGPTQSAYCLLLEGKPIDYGIHSNAEMLDQLKKSQHLRVLLAVEMIASYGMPVGKDVFETCVWIGRFLQVWDGRSIYVYRKDVKLFLCGQPRAKDPNVRQALLDKFGPQGTKNNKGVLYGMSADMWAALGVAVTAEDQIQRGQNGSQG